MWRAALAVVLIGVLVGVLVGPAYPDTFVLDNGQRMEGTIVERRGDKVVIQRRHDRFMTFRRRIVKIVPGPLSWEVYAARSKELKAGDAAGHYALASWCETKGLLAERRAQLLATIAADPNHARARKALGYVRRDGAWVQPTPAWIAEWGRALVEYAPGRHTRTFVERARVAEWVASGRSWIADKGNAERLATLRRAAHEALVGKPEALVAAAGEVPFAALEQILTEQKRPLASGASVVALMVGKTKTRLAIAVPAGYEADRPAPLLLAMHTGGGECVAARDRWARSAGAAGYLVAAPHNPAYFGKGWSSAAAERAVTLAAHDYMLAHYAVDPDRVVLHGGSAGGHGAYELALTHGDRFAAIFVEIAGPRLRSSPLLGNHLRLPIWSRQGARDQALMLAANRSAARLRRHLGATVDHVERPDWGHLERPEDDGDFLRWVKSHRRDAYAPSVHARFCTVAQGRVHWLSAIAIARRVPDPLGGRVAVRGLKAGASRDETQRAYTRQIRPRLARLSGRIVGQTVHIDTHAVRRFALHLSDRMLDLDQPVEIIVNGKRRSRGVLTRSIATLVDELRASGDTGRRYSVRKVFSVR